MALDPELPTNIQVALARWTELEIDREDRYGGEIIDDPERFDEPE